MLVEDGLAHAGPLSDLVHGGGVIAAAHEYFEGRVKQLPPTFVPWQPAAALPRIRRCGHIISDFGRGLTPR
jgi:hypothetical protein